MPAGAWGPGTGEGDATGSVGATPAEGAAAAEVPLCVAAGTAEEGAFKREIKSEKPAKVRSMVLFNSVCDASKERNSLEESSGRRSDRSVRRLRRGRGERDCDLERGELRLMSAGRVELDPDLPPACEGIATTTNQSAKRFKQMRMICCECYFFHAAAKSKKGQIGRLVPAGLRTCPCFRPVNKHQRMGYDCEAQKTKSQH